MAHESHDHSRSGQKALFIALGGSGVGLTILERLQIIIYAVNNANTCLIEPAK